MPSCWVDKCANSWKKGYSMHRFPQNVERRSIWVSNIGKSNFDSSKIYFICEVN